jgi:anti-sigma-K factor RskA
MADINHDAWRDEAGLYALGALAGKERDAFEAHLATCAECAAEVRALEGVVTALPHALPQVDPPAALRARVLTAAGAPQASSRSTVAQMPAGNHFSMTRTHISVNLAWLAVAALLLVSVALGAHAVTLRQRVGGLEGQLREAVNRLDLTERQLADATRAAERAQMLMAVLTSPDLKEVSLTGQPAAPRAAGRAFWSRSNGLLFAANDLPPLPAGRTYQLWFLTPGAPVSAGLIKPDQNGRIAAAFDTPPGTPDPTGVAVSIEPEGGVPAPTGAIYLAGLTQ